jgi:hypothetical protein
MARKIQEYALEHGPHLKYMCDATPYNLGQEAFQDILSGGFPTYLDEIGLDGIPVVLLTIFEMPAPLKIISTAASKDGRVLSKSVKSTFNLYNVKASDFDRFESDKGVENSGNDFENGLGKGGVYALCFHHEGFETAVSFETCSINSFWISLLCSLV